MDLKELEALKAEAAEAAQSDPRVALERYPKLAQIYDDHRYADGLLAIQFNWLLASLKLQNRRDNQRLITALFDAFEARHREGILTPLALEIAGRLRRLFHAPISGVDHETTSALMALLQEIEPSPLPLRRPSLESPPAGEALALLAPEDAALLVLDGLRGGGSWAQQPEAFLEHADFDAQISNAWTSCAEAFRAGAVTEAYLEAVGLLQVALDEAPAMAAAINLLLLRLERSTLPNTLRYEVILPEEQRRLMAMELHGRLAQRFTPVVGFEPFAEAQWRASRASAEGWQALRSARASRDGRRPDDVEREASVAIWRAHARRAEGDLEGAFEALSTSLGRAQREVFDAYGLSTLLLKEAAELRERQGRVEEALALYRAAFKVALPGIKPGARLERLVAALDDPSRAWCPRAQSLSIEVSVAISRLEEGGDLEWPRTLMALNHERFHVDEIARLSLLLELTQARSLDARASDRALEAALCLRDTSGITLARLYRAMSAREVNLEDALLRIEEACKDALKLSAGQLRRTVEVVAVELYLEANQPDRAQLHLRRAVDAMRGALPDQAQLLDPLGPKGDYSVEALVQRFMDIGQDEMAYRLAMALRRARLRRPGAGVRDRGRLEGQIQGQVEAWLDERFLEGDREGLEPIRAALEHTRYTWPTRHLKPGQLRITYHLSERGGLIFCENDEGVLVRPLQETRAGLEVKIDALLQAAQRSDSGALFRHSQDLWFDLLAPVEGLIRRAQLVMIAPDGPLRRLPFALVGDKFFLASYVDLCVLAAVDDPLQPPEQTPARDELDCFAVQERGRAEQASERGPKAEPRDELSACGGQERGTSSPRRNPADFSSPGLRPGGVELAEFGDAPKAPQVAYVVGDHATLRELQLGERCGEGGFERVETRLHEALSLEQLDEALSGARLLHLVGALDDDGRLALSASHPPLPAARIAEALADSGAATVALSASFSSGVGVEALEAALQGLIPGLSAGALVQLWRGEDEGAHATKLLSQLADVTDSKGLITRVGQIRRESINRGIPVKIWAAFEVYTAEWPRPR